VNPNTQVFCLDFARDAHSDFLFHIESRPTPSVVQALPIASECRSVLQGISSFRGPLTGFTEATHAGKPSRCGFYTRQRRDTLRNQVLHD
jgi:hypothetical protein